MLYVYAMHDWQSSQDISSLLKNLLSAWNDCTDKKQGNILMRDVEKWMQEKYWTLDEHTDLNVMHLIKELDTAFQKSRGLSQSFWSIIMAPHCIIESGFIEKMISHNNLHYLMDDMYDLWINKAHWGENILREWRESIMHDSLMFVKSVHSDSQKECVEWLQKRLSWLSIEKGHEDIQRFWTPEIMHRVLAHLWIYEEKYNPLSSILTHDYMFSVSDDMHMTVEDWQKAWEYVHTTQPDSVSQRVREMIWNTAREASMSGNTKECIWQTFHMEQHISRAAFVYHTDPGWVHDKYSVASVESEIQNIMRSELDESELIFWMKSHGNELSDATIQECSFHSNPMIHWTAQDILVDRCLHDPSLIEREFHDLSRSHPAWKLAYKVYIKSLHSLSIETTSELSEESLSI